MSLSQSLLASASGLRTIQAGMALVSSNVANADTPGYVRKTLIQTTLGADTLGQSVRVTGVNRELDLYVQRQLRTETSGGAYADLRAQFYQRIQLLLGTPGSNTTLESRFTTLTTALQALATSPESLPARSAVVNAAQVLTQELNGLTRSVQSLRGDAESALGASVETANEALAQIAAINRQLAGSPADSGATVALLDRRDAYIDQLSQLMDIRVVNTGPNQVAVYSGSGIQLAGNEAGQLAFDAQGTMTALTQWSSDPAERQVGTVTFVSPNGGSIDMLADGGIRSGKIAAYVEMRDQTLVQMQSQLDNMAAGLAQSLSDLTTAGTPVAGGFDLDLNGIFAGNAVRLRYTDVATNTVRDVTLLRVDDPGALPLTDTAIPAAGDRVVGINFSGGMASVVAQIQAALGASFTVSNPAGSVLRVIGGATATLTAASTTKTIPGLSAGVVQAPMFVDGSGLYTGSITAAGSQMAGFAGRIAVNAGLLADPSKLLTYGPSVAAGDTSRVRFISSQLSEASLTFSPESGIGSTATPFQGSLPEFLRQVLTQQGQAANAAENLSEGQRVVVNALRQRMNETSGVNIDQEMTNLLQLQSAYSANARVLSTVRDMLDTLMRI